jgi:hypothetical protein
VQWEYHVSYLDTSATIHDELDGWGREGWELVAVTPHESQTTESVLLAIFKRPKKEGASEPLVDFR